MDPSIAAQFGRMPLPKPAPSPAAEQRPPHSPSTGADLGGHLLAPRPAAAAPAPAPAAAASPAQPDLWGLDAPEALTGDSRGFSTSDPFGGAFDSLSGSAALAPAAAPPAPQASQDPFAALSAPPPQGPSDPFAGMAQPASQPGSQGAASFSKPADPPNRDPFASISSEVPGPAPNTAMARSPHARCAPSPGTPVLQ